LPEIFTGFRIAAGLSVIGAIVGEFIAGGGLGGIIDISRTQQRIDKVFAVLILASALGIALFGLVNLASRLTLRKHHAEVQPSARSVTLLDAPFCRSRANSASPSLQR
jgi:NitT/TauT family transport system permease protein